MCIGFIDGTAIRISRPGVYNLIQRSVYNVHKLVHALKFQALFASYSIILHGFGPAECRHNDMTLYQRSKLEVGLQD